MQNVIEVHGFNFSFTLKGLALRDDVFDVVNFNYGSGTFYQKFRKKVHESMHEDLKALKDEDIYVVDGHGDTFTFISMSKDAEKVRVAATRLLRICKAVHNYKDNVELIIKKRVLVEYISNIVIA